MRWHGICVSVPHMTTPPTPTVTRTVADEIRAEIARQRSSTRELAKSLSKSHTWLARRLRGETPLSIEDVVLIAKGLDVDPLPFIEKALTP